MSSIGLWVSVKRRAIASMVQKGTPEQFLAIEDLLKVSLSTLTMLIEPRIKNYQELINEVKWGRVNCKEAIDSSEILQRDLIGFFRSSALLFHPDKCHGSEDLRNIQTELFKQFQQLSETSLEKIKEGLYTLKNWLPLWGLEIQEVLDKITRTNVNGHSSCQKYTNN